MSDARSQEQSSHSLILQENCSSGIIKLTLNRPEQYIALSEALLSELSRALDDVRSNPTIRVVILAGAGKAFCGGHDLKEMRSRPDKIYYQDLFNRCGELMIKMIKLPQPIIAQVHGTATAAGCQLVANCDLAVASTEARFAVSGINLGLFCSTPSVPLSRNISRKQAFEMLMTGQFIDSLTAVRYGLINQTVDSNELPLAVLSLAESIASKPSESVRIGKTLFYKQLENNLSDAYTLASETMAYNMILDETKEGIDAFINKKKS